MTDEEKPKPRRKRRKKAAPKQATPELQLAPEFQLAPKPALKPTPQLDRESVTEAVYQSTVAFGMDHCDALRSAEDVADRLKLAGQSAPDGGDVLFYDLRSEQDYTYPNNARKVKLAAPGVPVMRKAEDVTTIVVHQTAVEFGVSSRAVDAAGGDVELARARRALDVACHAMAFRQGYYVAAHPLLAYVNHGNRFNATSLGLEIDGRYPGLEDDPSTAAREDLQTTWGGDPSELTEATIKAARAALRWLVEEARAAGCPIQYVVAHRQSSDSRRSDPGQGIWREVVLKYAVSELGLIAKRESPWREGRPIPVEWDPDGIGNY